MLLYIIILIVVAVSFFFIGMFIGINKKDYKNPNKIYEIKFDKLVENNRVIKDSVLVNSIVNFCDSIGIEILNLEIKTWGDGELKVKCNKNQYYLLILELSKSENRIELKKINF